MDKNEGGDEYDNADYNEDHSDKGSLNENLDEDDEQHTDFKHHKKIEDDEDVESVKHFLDEREVPGSNVELTASGGGTKSDIHKLGSMGMSFGDLIKNESLKSKSNSVTSEHRSVSTEKSTDKDEESLGSDVNICISDTKLENLKEKLTIRQKLLKIFGVRQNMTQKEFDKKIRILYKCCLKSVRDLHELHLRRIMGMEIIHDIIMRAKSITVTMPHVIHITWCIMSCIHHFQLRLRTVTTGLISYSRRKQAEECMKSYTKLIRLFRPEMHRIILNAVLTFYREGKLWEIEFAVTDLIVELLKIYKDAEEGVEDILCKLVTLNWVSKKALKGHDTVETATLMNLLEAKCLTQILYEILKMVRWKRMSEYLMKKLLSMLESSIVPKSTDNYNYIPLRKGLEISIRNTIGNLANRDLIKMLHFIIKKMRDKDITDDAILCFGCLAAYGAKKFRMNSRQSSIFEGPLLHIFQLYPMHNHILTLFATRIWQNLIDRNNNGKHFHRPRIFLQDCNYGLTIPKCQDGDKSFFKSVRHLVYEISLSTFINYLVCQMALENMYQAIALTMIEIPCGYTASCFVTVAMSMQDYAFSISQEKLVESHHLHATALSLLTLVCYIHKATVFYDYVNTIMERRAEWAPHLNPPLKPHYKYAQHHVLWNKPDLFFEDWEARYGLWQCFRTKRKNVTQKSIVV